jgi:hypothetical protein
VLTDVALMIADGVEAIADIEVLRHQGEMLRLCCINRRQDGLPQDLVSPSITGFDVSTQQRSRNGTYGP